MRWIIVGCGYTGERLASRLVATGAPVAITRRTPEAVAGVTSRVPGTTGAVVDLADRATLESLAAGDAILVCCAPPGADPDGEIRTLARATRAARRVIYVSSTGVYGAGGGAWVDESWPLAPITGSGQARLRAERALPEGTLVLRAAGIYGPGRGLLARMRAGTYRVVGDGTSHVSRIHVDDLVEAIVLAGTRGGSGAYNVADDAPTPIGEVADAVAAMLGLAAPPRVPIDQVAAEVAGMLTADRRIANTRMKRELGIILKYPSWREGVAAELDSSSQ